MWSTSNEEDGKKDINLFKLFIVRSLTLKELRETRIWLLIIVRADLIKPASKLDDLLDESNQLISIFVKSIGTAKKNKDKTS